MKKVFVNGYGSIGSRITSFLKDDSEITVIGVGKYTPDDKVEIAISRGLNVYVPEKKLDDFSNYKIAGTIESALDDCDLVIDASPGGFGYKNKKNIYEPKNIPAIYQGGESTMGSEAVSDLLFNSRVNYEHVIGKQHVMQGSCNVTGMGRILEPLRNKFGDGLIRFDVTLIRRWADIINEIFNTTIPEGDDYASLNGLLHEKLKDIPQEGDKVEIDELRIIVEKVLKNIPKKIRIERIKH